LEAKWHGARLTEVDKRSSASTVVLGMGQGSSLIAKSVLSQGLGGLGEGGRGMTGIWGQEWRWLRAMTHPSDEGVAHGEGCVTLFL
jgi:hypothetical protein